MNEQKIQSYLHNETVKRVNETLLTESNINLINKELPSFKEFLINNEVWYTYKHGITNKYCNWLDFHKCDGQLAFKAAIIAYKASIENLLNKHISWSEFGMLINSIKN